MSISTISSDPHPEAAAAAADPSLIELDGIVKSFGGVRALRGVHFDLKPGEVHALLGQNGAGKSTLIKVLAGVVQKDAGRIRIDGREVDFKDAAASRQAGLAVVYQDLSLVPTMSVADNLYLAREPNRFGLVKRRRMMRDARQFIDDHALGLDPSTPVEALPFAYRQLLEIAKALSGNVRILVLDEPTSSLSKGEEGILFEAVEQITERGVGVIYITHRLSEVFRLSDRVTVLRDGTNAGTFDTDATNMAELVEAIVGPSAGDVALYTDAGPQEPEATPTKPALADTTPTPPVLEMSGVVNDRLKSVDLAIMPGEIVGLAGMVGSGRTEILETIFGLRKVAAGEIRLNGQHLRVRDAADAIRHGIGLVPEDRHLEGLVLEHTIENNLSMPWLSRLSWHGLHRRAQSRAVAEATMADFSVKAPSPATRLNSLSGGNQQKVVFGRWRDAGCRLLLLDEPTVGVDVGAREQIYAVVRRIVADEAAALVVSSDLAELLLLCDRIAVVADGRIAAVVRRADLKSEEDLHHLVQEPQA